MKIQLMRAMVCLWVVIASAFAPAHAEDVFVPSYREPTVRSESPDLLGRRVIRFVTSDDFPPFQAIGPDRVPYGLNIDLARALCDVLQVSCTVQALPWDEMLEGIGAGRADAVIAGVRPTERSRQNLDFTNRYLQLPARFMALRDNEIADMRPEALLGTSVAVIAGTAHEAYLKAFFTGAEIQVFTRETDARLALTRGDAELLFGDGVSLAQWLATEEGSCCAFRGGPYIESRFFGEGFAIGVRRGDTRLRQALDHALDVVSSNGAFGNIYLRYFPVGIY